MAIELDHFFILTGPGAPQADLLSAIGLVEGPANDHPGQGTANRRFFFSNATLELIYIRDTHEAATGPGSRLRFADRAADANTSPFGMIVRTIPGSTGVPFPGWHYYPEYFPDDQCFLVGENADVLEEPLCICMPTDLPRPKNLLHPENPLKVVTELIVSVPVGRPSVVLDTVARCDGITLRLNEPHGLELVFNHGETRQSKDMTPDLPLTVRW